MALSLGSGLVCSVLVALCMVVPNRATDYTVGDSAGWAMGVDYTTWTSGKTFKSGDNLVFNYDGSSHKVDEVSKGDYSTCTSGNTISTDNSGATTIPLKTAGTHYFICGAMGHCSGGMKLAVTVVPSDSTAPATTPLASPVAPPPSSSVSGFSPSEPLALPRAPSSSASGSTTATSSFPPTTGNTKSSTNVVKSSSVVVSPSVVVVGTLVAARVGFLLKFGPG